MFENATRKKYRYATVRGLVTTEDLWDLPLTSSTKMNLDTVAQGIYDELEKASEKSFVKKVSRGSKIWEDKLEIIKHIIDVKLKELEDKETALVKKEQKELLMTVIAEKEVDELKGKSVKELKKELGKL